MSANEGKSAPGIIAHDRNNETARYKGVSARMRKLRKRGPAISVTENISPDAPLPTADIEYSETQVQKLQRGLDNLRQHILHAKKVNSETIAYFVQKLEIPQVKIKVREFLANMEEDIYAKSRSRDDQIILDANLYSGFEQILIKLNIIKANDTEDY